MADSGMDAVVQGRMRVLREESMKVRELLQSCREDGVDLRRFRERLQGTRRLVEQHRLDEALARLRELKLQLLDQIVQAEGRSPVLPGVVENPPPLPAVPAENPLPPVTRAPSWKIKVPKH